MLDNITPALDKVKTADGVDRSSSNIDFVNEVAVQNTHLTIEKLKQDSPVLNEMIENGEIQVVGAMYEVASGKVSFFD